MLCFDLLHNEILWMEVLMLIISTRGQGEVPVQACPRSTIAEIEDEGACEQAHLDPPNR
jgi:hypothetical protein